MYFIVYKTTNLINGKIYIGKHVTKNPYDKYLGSGKQLKDAIKKYGLKNFKKEVLFLCVDKIDMAAKEKELVTEEFCKRSDTYNMHEGGEGGFAHVRQSPQYKDWCHKGGINSTGKEHPNWGMNKFKSGETRTIELSRKANEGRIKNGLSEEHKARISLASKKREEQRRLTGYYQKKHCSDSL
jgi:hypothetical protein